jgi:four helix bundle protein
MFDFQNLNVYTMARDFNHELIKIVEGHDLEEQFSNRLTDGAYNIMIGIARGTAPINLKDRSDYFIEARASVHECAANLDYLLNTKQFEQATYDQLAEPLDALSKMLYVLSRKTSEMPDKRVNQAEPVDS